MVKKVENTKLSKSELQKLKDFQVENDNITYSLGNIEVQKAILEGQKNELINELADLQERSNSLAISLQEKYGAGSINYETGEVTVQ